MALDTISRIEEERGEGEGKRKKTSEYLSDKGFECYQAKMYIMFMK